MNVRKLNKKRLILTLVIALAIIGALGLTLHLVEKHFEKDEQFGDTGDWGKQGTENHFLTIGENDYYYTDNLDTYLLIGTDGSGELAKAGEKKGSNGDLADFLLLAVINRTQETYGFLQLDRNTMTDVTVLDKDGKEQGTYPEQVCTAHWYGVDESQRNKNTVDAVSYIFGGLPIQGYYKLNMEDIGAVNHAVGGVVVDIDTDMTKVDPDFQKGASVLLTDAQAEKFVRARMNVGDGTNAARMKRQREYMQKVYNLTMSQIRENPEYMQELYEELEGKVDSELPGNEVSKIANQLTQFRSCGILTFDGKTKTADTFDDGKKHEEFYMSESSAVETLGKVMNIAPAEELGEE